MLLAGSCGCGCGERDCCGGPARTRGGGDGGTLHPEPLLTLRIAPLPRSVPGSLSHPSIGEWLPTADGEYAGKGEGATFLTASLLLLDLSSSPALRSPSPDAEGPFGPESGDRPALCTARSSRSRSLTSDMGDAMCW